MLYGVRPKSIVFTHRCMKNVQPLNISVPNHLVTFPNSFSNAQKIWSPITSPVIRVKSCKCQFFFENHNLLSLFSNQNWHQLHCRNKAPPSFIHCKQNFLQISESAINSKLQKCAQIQIWHFCWPCKNKFIKSGARSNTNTTWLPKFA